MSDDKGIKVLRHAGHPWEGKGGWDLIARAKARFWRVWIKKDNRPAAVLYKPSGIRAAWVDPIRGGAGLPAL